MPDRPLSRGLQSYRVQIQSVVWHTICTRKSGDSDAIFRVLRISTSTCSMHAPLLSKHTSTFTRPYTMTQSFHLIGVHSRAPTASGHAHDPDIANLTSAQLPLQRTKHVAQVERIPPQRGIWCRPLQALDCSAAYPPQPASISRTSCPFSVLTDTSRLIPPCGEGRLTGGRAASNREDMSCVAGRSDAPIGRFSL